MSSVGKKEQYIIMNKVRNHKTMSIIDKVSINSFRVVSPLSRVGRHS